MNKNELIEDFLKNFKPKQDQSWKSCYFFTHYLKKNHKIDAELIEGMSRINKIDYWTVRLEGDDIDCLLYTSPSPRDGLLSRMPSSA